MALNWVKARRAPSRSWCVNPKSISLIASALTASQIGESDSASAQYNPQ